MSTIRLSSLTLSLRIGLAILLIAAVAWLLLPVAPSPEALAVADRHLATELPRCRVVAPPTATRFFGSSWLTYQTEYEGAPAKVAITLVRQEGRLVVHDARLLIGEVDSGRTTRYLIPLLGTWALICLVFFFAIPRTFGRKCPRDLTMLLVVEKVVVPEQFDRSGVGFEPIIERIYACRTCEFRHFEALSDPKYRQTVVLGRLAVWAIKWCPVFLRWLPRDIDDLAAEHDAMRMTRAITKEQYQQLLSDARKAARAKSSTDSPWLHRS